MALGNMVAFADPVRARTNVAAWNLINQVNGLNREIAIRQLRLATGRQQPRVEDGASFFAIWNKMKNQVRGKGMAIDNVGDAKDELSLAEAGMLRIDELLGKMRDLVVRASSDTLTPEQREDVRQELLNLYMAIGEVVKRTKFNEGGKGADALLDGFSHTYQVGPNESDKFEVQIRDILRGITNALSPELSEKMSVLTQVLSSASTETREALAKVVLDTAGTLPEGNVRRGLEALGWGLKNPTVFEAEFISTVAAFGQEDMNEVLNQISTLFDTRLDTAANPATGADFVGDNEVRSLLVGLAPLIHDLGSDSGVLNTLGSEFQRIAQSSKIEHPGLKQELQDVADSILAMGNGFKNAIANLETVFDTTFASPTQKLFLAQDISFFASSDSRVTSRPNVQNALNQLALDAVNEVDGLPNFRAALEDLSDQERSVLQTVLREVATDTQNGLSFHLAQPNLDGGTGPFTQAANTFANFVVTTFEGVPELEDKNDLALGAVFQGVAGSLSVQFPRIANQLNNVITLLTDNSDANDADLATALAALGGQIESDTGTSSFFTNPVARGSIRNAFLAQTSGNAFQAMSPAFRQAYTALADSLVSTLDLNGQGGPFSQTAGTFGSMVTAIKEKNPPVVPQGGENDDVDMASMLQGAASALAGSMPNISGLLNQAVSLMTDENDGNDAQLASVMTALGAQIEQESGGQNNVNGTVRAELRRVFLEQTATPAFANLSLPGKAAYLTMAEALGAYTAGQVSELDAGLDALATALVPDPANVVNELADLADVLTDKQITGAERDAVIKGLIQTAQKLGNNNETVTALHNLIDDPNSEDDLVGFLKRYVPDSHNDVLRNALSDASGQMIRGAIEDFLRLENNTDGMMLIAGVDDAINFVKDELIHLGGIQTKLTGFENILSESMVSEDSVASRFGDADLAREQVELTKLQLLSQLASAQAAAANVLPSQVMGGLFGGG